MPAFALAAAVAPAAALPHASSSSSSSATSNRRLRGGVGAARWSQHNRRGSVGVVTRAAGSGGAGGDQNANSDDDKPLNLNTGILYERMKALQAKEAAERAAVVDAAVELDQAIVAGIRGDAAERPPPNGDDFDALIEHLLSTPIEAMEYESVRCGPMITAAFQAHIALNIKRAGAQGPAGEDTVVELQALEAFVRVARERQAARDDAMRRRRQLAKNQVMGQEDGGRGGAVLSPGYDFVESTQATEPAGAVRATGTKFRVLMEAAAEGVDALRGAIVELARGGEVDDALVTMLRTNADNARGAKDDGRAKFLDKVADVCEREWRNVGGVGGQQ